MAPDDIAHRSATGINRGVAAARQLLALSDLQLAIGGHNFFYANKCHTKFQPEIGTSQRVSELRHPCRIPLTRARPR